MLGSKPAHEQALENLAQGRDLLPVQGDGGCVNVADLKHEGYARQKHPMVPVIEQSSCLVLESLQQLWHLAKNPAVRRNPEILTLSLDHFFGYSK